MYCIYMAMYCTRASLGFEFKWLCTALGCSDAVYWLLDLIFLAELCTAMYGSVLHWCTAGV